DLELFTAPSENRLFTSASCLPLKFLHPSNLNTITRIKHHTKDFIKFCFVRQLCKYAGINFFCFQTQKQRRPYFPAAG
ncbi:MAG: hypothetical protein ACLFUN_03620, partial [Desulfobacterales bacterium]